MLGRVIRISWWSQQRDFLCSENVQTQQAALLYRDASDESMKVKCNFFPDVGHGKKEQQSL